MAQQPTPDLSLAVVPEESSTERYERLAAEFERETGMIAPGKDVPAGLYSRPFEERLATWKWWIARRSASPVSVPEERQEKRTPPLSRIGNELRDVRDSYRLQSASKRLVTNVASVLDALAVAVKGCDAELPDGTLCGEYDFTRIALCNSCEGQRDAAITALLDGRTK